jgi:hypothetical protein
MPHVGDSVRSWSASSPLALFDTRSITTPVEAGYQRWVSSRRKAVEGYSSPRRSAHATRGRLRQVVECAQSSGAFRYALDYAAGGGLLTKAGFTTSESCRGLQHSKTLARLLHVGDSARSWSAPSPLALFDTRSITTLVKAC